ncbi:MAG: hypothetical protein HDQ44_01650 [Desulfovibrio sp.]|nr:hypothetical protein [Desulfovibrio sp.]
MQNLAENLDEHELMQEALANFAALLDDLDFATELEMLGIGRLQFLRRKQMLIELRGLYTALWRLALGRSFPNDADAMFQTFMQRYVDSHAGKSSGQIVERAQQYWGMLEPAGDADFSKVSSHLASFVERGQKELPPLVLGLALHIRSAYRLIFDRLI